MPPPLHIALDLGAGSGRAVVGGFGPDGLVVGEAHRFQYSPRRIDGHLRWDMSRLLDGLRTGLGRAGAEAVALGRSVASVGVDSWGVDYGLVDEDGGLVEEPVCYRDERTAGVLDEVFGTLSRQELFARTGIQVLALNTLFQLAAHVREGLPPRAVRLLMMPDLCHHQLCGSVVTELTNASTTQLLAAGRAAWDDELFGRLDLPLRLMPPIVAAGSRLGTLTHAWQQATGLSDIAVLAPATHDTGSAVAGTPLQPGWAYISSGTWSLVGVERERPLITDAVAAANITNEIGVFGTVRFLKNVMGLWILESCRCEWDAAGSAVPYSDLLARAADIEAFPGFVHPDDPRFFNPPSMVDALRSRLCETEQPAYEDPVLLTKVVLDSLALRYASIIRTMESLTGDAIPGIHIVGGGSMNTYLNQATANAAGRPVLAGPSEATAIGNLAVQAIASGELPSLSEARALLAARLPLTRFEPRHASRWARASEAYHAIERAVERAS